MYNKIMKVCLSFTVNHLTVSKSTNEVLKEIRDTVIALLGFLALAIDWDATLDNLQILGGTK